MSDQSRKSPSQQPQERQSRVSHGSGNGSNSRSYRFLITTDGNNDRNANRTGKGPSSNSLTNYHQQHRNRQTHAIHRRQHSSPVSSRSNTYTSKSSIGGELDRGNHSRSFSPPHNSLNTGISSSSELASVQLKSPVNFPESDTYKRQSHLPHLMDHASDSSSGYIRNMGYLHINSENEKFSNNDNIMNTDKPQVDEDGSGTVSTPREHLEQKPPAYTASSAASIESQSIQEKDGYYSSGAMSDGNISRRSILSGESDQGMTSDTGGHHARTSSIGGGSIESNRFAHHASYYQPSEACKSDIATICSSSMVDEMDIASLLSGEANQTSTSASVYTPATTGYIPRTGSFSGKKSNLSSAFASERSVDYPSSGSRHVSMQEPPMVLNDMGPPVSRIIIQQRHESRAGSRAGSIGGHSSASGGVASDLAHLDTDDGASMTAEIDGHSVHSNIHRDDGHVLSEHEQTVASADEDDDDKNKNENERPPPFTDSVPQTGSGRISPGGTVYKGRGVRRYQGRYMNLPLKRFKQNGGAEDDDSSLLRHNHREGEEINRAQRTSPDFWDRKHSRSRSRSRGRCRSNHSFSRSHSYNRRSRSFTRNDDTRNSRSRSHRNR